METRIVTLDGGKGLTKNHIDGLHLKSKDMLAVVLKNFTPQKEREELINKIHNVGLDDFSGETKDGRQQVKKPRIGVNVFHHAGNKEAYFAGLAQARKKFDAIFTGIANPVRSLMTCLENASGMKIILARENGQELAPFVIRSLADAPVHNDDIRIEAHDWHFHQKHTTQIAHNAYLVSPEGSDLMIFPTDDIVQARNGEIAPILLHPESGDTILFNSTMPHAVTKGRENPEARLSVSGFLSPTTEGNIQFWV